MQREILVDGATPESRIAIVEDQKLAELFIERPAARGLAGNIYKGRVSNILPGMQSAFVNIGLERDAFLYVEDVASPEPGAPLPVALDEEAAEAPAEPGQRSAPPRPPIEDLLAAGRDLVVQVTKDPAAGKGARVTTHVSLPGRFLVHLPGVAHVGVSRRIVAADERDRLKALAADVLRDLGVAGGCIVRTVGEGQGAAALAADARALAQLWETIKTSAETRPAPALLHHEVGAIVKVLRDVLADDVQQVLIEGEAAWREALAFVERVQPALAPKVRLYEGPVSLFDAHGIEKQIERALRARVWLKSGGSIVINQTEALVAIDVNTGKFVGTKSLEDTILSTNLEAVGEIVRQVRLRDLAGIIVIDFIDMELEASRAKVLAALERELERDRAKSRTLQISEFGLVEITRQRTKRSLERVLCEPCEACHGSGRVRSADTLFFAVLREALRRRPALGRGATIEVSLHPEIAPSIEARRGALAEALGQGMTARRIRVRADAALAREACVVSVGSEEPTT